MRSYLDSKSMAKSLRQALAERKLELSHGDCLELVARQFGLANWNTLAARIAAASEGGDALRLPQDWHVTKHTDQTRYRLGLDPDETGTALIESRFARGSGIDLGGDDFAVLMQSVMADDYRGRRLRLTASLRTDDADQAAIWMRVDRAPGDVLRFDNLMQRKREGSLRGTTPWTERSIVLDVPDDAASLHYGFLMQGHGRVRARAFRLDAVGPEIAPTAGRGRHLDRPANLDFTQPQRPHA